MLTIYVDILIINNTFMSLAILWAVGKLLKLKIRLLNLLYAALFANLYTLLIIYIRFNDFIFSIIIQVILNLLAASIMIYISYDIDNTRQFFKILGTLYLTTFVTIGASLSFFYIYGINPFKAGCLISGIIFLWLIGQYGWRFLQTKNTPKELMVEIIISIKNKKIKVKGLVDTGNKLYDPMSQLSVIIVEHKYMKEFFSKELQAKLNKNKGGIIKQISILSEYDWQNRIRILPYNVIGQDDGILIGIRPDLVRVITDNNNISLEKIIIGITEKSLDYEGEYQALVNPEIL